MTILLALGFGLLLGVVVGFLGGVHVSLSQKGDIARKIMEDLRPLGNVTDAGGGEVRVHVDRDLAHYPSPGDRVFLGSHKT